MAKRASSRQVVGRVQKQNWNAPGGLAELSARIHEDAEDNNLTGASGPDSKLRPWYFGLGYEMIADPQTTIQMAPMPSNEIPPTPGRGGFPQPKGKGAADGIT